jgi:hypothetical protein
MHSPFDCRPFSEMKNRTLTRLSLLHSAAKLMCANPACASYRTLQRVNDHFANGQTALECGCRREAEARKAA